MLARNRVTKRLLYALDSHGVGEESAAWRSTVNICCIATD